MKKELVLEDRLVVLRAVESIIEKKLELISLKEIIDMTGTSRYQFIICAPTRTGGYETSVLIAPRQGTLFNKTVEEAKELLSSKDKNKLRTIGWVLKDLPEFREFKELFPQIRIKSDFCDEVVLPKPPAIPIPKLEEEVDPYEGWELTLKDNRYHVNHKRACKFVK
jgi:hypothetical protein